jgi:hypothetical protein
MVVGLLNDFLHFQHQLGVRGQVKSDVFAFGFHSLGWRVVVSLLTLLGAFVEVRFVLGVLVYVVEGSLHRGLTGAQCLGLFLLN